MSSSVIVLDPAGPSGLLLICDHATNWIPAEYGDLGLTPCELGSHVAWDEGADVVTRVWSRNLGVRAVMGTVSRLIIDLNRQLDRVDVIPAVSHGVRVPGNENLTADEREARLDRYYYPYHKTVDRMTVEGARMLLTVHSFSQEVDPIARDFEIGILFDQFEGLAESFAGQFEAAGCRARLNEPYSGKSDVVSTARRHGREHDRVYFELEINSRLIDQDDKAAEWAERLTPVMKWLRDEV